MRPDVAAAYDQMAAAAAADGITLIVVSGFRSDAEQAELFAAHPDPKWVAPPGTSLHRCATELDLGPESAYGWIDANATRFGFVQRYSWEAWHMGYDRPPAPCSEAGNSVGATRQDAAPPGGETLPSFVPPRFRDTLIQAAAKWNVSAALLAGAADGGEQLRSLRRVARRRRGHRPVHARDRRLLRPAGSRSTRKKRSTPRRT